MTTVLYELRRADSPLGDFTNPYHAQAAAGQDADTDLHWRIELRDDTLQFVTDPISGDHTRYCISEKPDY